MNEVPKRILFVCVQNSNRSQMAEAFARMLGGSGVEVYSAGSVPSGVVHPRAVEAMRELGYDLTTHFSKSLADLPDVEFDLAATMGCGDTCPFIRARQREDWDIPDPTHLDSNEYRVVRSQIEKRVRLALESLGVTTNNMPGKDGRSQP